MWKRGAPRGVPRFCFCFGVAAGCGRGPLIPTWANVVRRDRGTGKPTPTPTGTHTRERGRPCKNGDAGTGTQERATQERATLSRLPFLRHRPRSCVGLGVPVGVGVGVPFPVGVPIKRLFASPRQLALALGACMHASRLEEPTPLSPKVSKPPLKEGGFEEHEHIHVYIYIHIFAAASSVAGLRGCGGVASRSARCEYY